MKTFVYQVESGKLPTFEAAGKAHDDRVYSLAWAIWTLRDSELAAYELNRIVCHSRSQHARLCYLRGGGDAVLHCSNECEAHKRVQAMHLQHMRRRIDDEMTLPEFFKTKVRRTGFSIYQGV